MGRNTKEGKFVPKSKRYTSPAPKFYNRSAENLKRDVAPATTKNWYEDTIIWGIDDAFPLRLAQAVQKSPAASACISTRAQFIKGSGFTDKSLMKQVVNVGGDTLWQLHCRLSDAMALFRGFSVNLKFNRKEVVTNAYDMSFESARFVKPLDPLATHIDRIKYNPYYGTDQFKKDYTTEYPVYDPSKLKTQIEAMGNLFPGQVYYYGKTSPLHRFYPMPEYWSAEKWINIDGKIQEFHDENLDNGFFQSVLMTIIGDPNAPSTNPKYVTEDTVDGVTTQRSTRTMGEEFEEMMQANFSGSKKAGNIMVNWARTKDDVQNLQPFPNNTNSGLFETLQDLTTKNITIATKTPGILANISEGTNLGSGGSEIQKAIEYMQSNVVEDQMVLIDFYNEVLLPGMGIQKKVEIQNFKPVTVIPEIDDKVFDWLTDEEKAHWIRKAYPEINITRFQNTTVAPVTIDGKPVPATPEIEINDNLKNMTGRQQQAMLRVIRQFTKGTINEATARIQLKNGFGFTDEEITEILGLNDTTDNA
jgi:hypothetical protein